MLGRYSVSPLAGGWIWADGMGGVMEQAMLPDWESQLIEEAISTAERRLKEEETKAKKRAIQLAREQAYHRLAVEIDRPSKHRAGPGQLSLFPVDPTLFDVKE